MPKNLDIRLAGFNIDADLMQSLDSGSTHTLTPETLSAAYARISRSALSIDELRLQARREVARARQSNSRIIFSMGHHSIAEHAVFNFDIMGLSRLAMEEIETMRLVSFTEKSQRYVRLNRDTMIPEELSATPLQTEFARITSEQNRFYADALEMIENYLSAQAAAKKLDKASAKQLRNLAKEDARYGLPLATRGQLGMTINARNLEALLRRAALSGLREVREFGRRLYELVQPVAPSLILFPDPSSFDRKLAHALSGIFPVPEQTAPCDDTALFSMVEAPRYGDDVVLSAFLSRIHGISRNSAAGLVNNLDASQKHSLFMKLFSGMEFFDSVPREFELPFFSFDLVVSASCFAQLKRHRMATLIPSAYDPGLGFTMPEVFSPTGLADRFQKLIENTNRIHKEISASLPALSAYVLTNAHRRRVILKMNLREIFHFVRLRADQHAQWDIRNLALWMSGKVRESMPLAALLLCGKSDFVHQYESVFHQKPQHQI